jgi:hypothetical protein
MCSGLGEYHEFSTPNDFGKEENVERRACQLAEIIMGNQLWDATRYN